MNLLTSARTLGHGLLLSSSLFLLQANPVIAAEAVGDAQMQARDLLSGTVGGRTSIVNESRAIPSSSDQTPSLDPQEQARQLILGKPNVGGIHRRAVDHLTYGDPQESARRMILGDGVRATAKHEEGGAHG